MARNATRKLEQVMDRLDDDDLEQLLEHAEQLAGKTTAKSSDDSGIWTVADEKRALNRDSAAPSYAEAPRDD